MATLCSSRPKELHSRPHTRPASATQCLSLQTNGKRLPLIEKRGKDDLYHEIRTQIVPDQTLKRIL